MFLFSEKQNTLHKQMSPDMKAHPTGILQIKHMFFSSYAHLKERKTMVQVTSAVQLVFAFPSFFLYFQNKILKIISCMVTDPIITACQ